jgi:L-lactate dehydrogenase complex protein LldE
MKITLFVPCYMDAVFPEVGVATLELLERLGCAVEYPDAQTCCGQPMVNSGSQDDAAVTEALFVDCFAGFRHDRGPLGQLRAPRPASPRRHRADPGRPPGPGRDP